MTALEPGIARNSQLRGWALDFDAAWPSARARVASVLGGRGLQGADVDDLAQEVAIRALRDRGRFGSHEHFVRWCCRVAINLHNDAARRQRLVNLCPPVDAASTHDTAAAAQGRMALEALAAGLAELSPEGRRLLLEPGPAGSRRETVRLAVRRHRLRARLAALVEGLAAAFPGVRRLSRSLSTPAKVGLAAVPVVVAGVLMVPGAISPQVERPDELVRPAVAVPGPVSSAPGRSEGAERATRAPATAGQRRPPSAPSTTVASARTLVEFRHPAVPPVKVWQDHRADDHPVLCVFGHLNTCVNQPGPLAGRLPPAPQLP